MLIALLILLALLAFANGANDNGKGVATLVGMGAATPRRALAWAAVTTACGAALSFGISGAMVERFSRAGAIVGMGLKLDARAVRWKKLGEIALSWLVTLPIAALLAAGLRLLLR